jgi:glycosyltransferase involved in cell wall biosynthesis
VDNNFFYSKIKKKNIIRFLFVGKINFIIKGVNTLLKAIKSIKLSEHNKKKIYFKIVGNGKDFEKTKNFLSKHKLKNVKLINFKNQHELKSIYRSSDVLVIPSNLEPWGLVVNEAMSAGNAIICSDKVGSRFDLVKNNYNGLIFRSKNHVSLSRKINYFIYNKNLLIKFQQRSQKIISNYNFDGIYKTLNNLMLKI